MESTLTVMKTSIAVTVAMLVISGSTGGRAYAESELQAHQDHSKVHAAHETAPVLPVGQLWPTDAPLRAAMLKIRTAAVAAAPAYERKELHAKDARALAVTVEKAVADMVSNCRLPPAPDAALHVLIGQMTSAAESLKSTPESAAGLPQLLAALREYQSTFDHPGWPDSAH